MRLPHILTLGIVFVCLGAADTSAQESPAEPPQTPAARSSSAPGVVAPTQAPTSSGGSPTQSPLPEDTRTQYPRFLANSYFSVNVGFLGYSFSHEQLEPGFRAESVAVRHLAARVVLLGHEFNKYLSVQGTYLRPVRFVAYRNVNGDERAHHVWVNFATLTLKPQYPLNERVTSYGEIGFGITSRHGFTQNQRPVIRDAHFTTPVLGGGIEYHVNPTWDLTTGLNYSPAKAAEKQPRAVMWSAGFRYNMRPLSAERVAANRETSYVFPERLLQIDYTTNGLGYGFNNALSSKIPVFWGGDVQVSQGLGVNFDRNVFHSRRIFAFDLGSSFSYMRSRSDGDNFVTLSVYPQLRLTLLRTAPADLYLSYSLAGPTYISRYIIDGRVIGRQFTFQDMLGVGVFLRRDRRISAGIKIKHYSNGSIVPDNVGVMIPMTFSIGYAF